MMRRPPRLLAPPIVALALVVLVLMGAAAGAPVSAAPSAQSIGRDGAVAGGTPGTDRARGPDVGIEAVIGTDERVQISPATSDPWRWITRLEISANTGSFTCSGFFVGPQIVATAGHCLYSASFGGDNWANSVRVIPGKDGFSEPFGSQVVPTGSLNSVNGWVTFGDPEFDYGWIVLPDETLHDQVGSFGIGVFDDAELASRLVNLAGYPGDKPAGTLWHDADVITGVGSHIISYEIDTFGGQSGAPIWAFDGGVRQVVGIHTRAPSPACNFGDNCGTRIRDAVASNFESAGAFDNSVDPGAVTCFTLTKSASPVAGGSVDHAPPNSGGCPTDSATPEYVPGTVVDVEAVPAATFQWDTWSGADDDTTNPTTRTMDANRSVTAFFVATGLTCDGVPATIVGTAGDDFLFGTPGADVIVALDGRDVIIAGEGDDVICAGEGDREFILAGSGANRVFGEGGVDVLFGGPDDDLLDGGAGFDVCLGGLGGDTGVACELSSGIP